MSRSLGILLALALPGAALAQDAVFDAHGFDLTAQDGDPRDSYTVHRPGSLEQNAWYVGGVLEYAHRPLVLVTETGSSDDVNVQLDHVMAVNLTGGFTPHERVRFNAKLPVYFATWSEDGGMAGPAAGDLRLDAQLLAVDPADSGMGIGVVPWIDLPLGAQNRFLGRRAVGGGFVVAATRELEDWTMTANLGVQFEPSIDLENLKGSDNLVMGLAGNRMLDDSSSIGLELHALAAFQSNERSWTGSPAEVMASYRKRLDSGASFNGGIALPVSPGAGAAAFRIFLGGAFGNAGGAGTKDTDLDGITDDLDACPAEPETVNGYIDEDGCPDSLSTLSIDVRFNGESLDGARLVVTGPDGDDTTTTTAGEPWSKEVQPQTLWKAKATKGECLEGELKQLVDQETLDATVEMALVTSATVRVKAVDASGKPVPGVTLVWDTATPECVPEPPAFGDDGAADIDVGPGTHTMVIGAPGYRVVESEFTARPGDDIPVEVTLQPTKLRVEKSRIVILEKVQFAFNKATIRDVSFELLDEVADVIRRNPQAGRVEVQGHTDSKGSDTYNQTLSQKRAEAVVEYLVGKGVSKDRLIPKGFGEAAPIATNDTETGRAKNRRVEFVLIDQKDQSIEEPVPDGE